MHNKHVCPEYASDCKDQFPVFSPVGINKKDLAGMIPVFSTIGRGPRGEGVTVKQIEDGSFQFISTISGEIVSEVPVLEANSFEVINNTPNPQGGEPIRVTIRQNVGDIVKDCNITIPSGEDGASVYTCAASFEKNESNRYSLLLSSFATTPSVGDSVIFKTVDEEDEFLTFGEIYSITAGTVGVVAPSYLGTGWDSPNIGDNGNWWIGTSDTGIPATGPKGDGLPEGGELGQIMTKTESGPMWADAPGVNQTVPIDMGGTGATTAEGAREALNVYSKSEVDERSIRAGFIYAHPSDTLPEGFLWCDGAEHSRTEYPELFAAIGTTYGPGNGVTTFNVPDMCGRVPVGTGNGFDLGDTGGEVEHTLTDEEMPNHTHSFTHPTMVWSTAVTDGVKMESTNQRWKASDNVGAGVTSVGGDQPHNNMQPYTVVNYIIATGQGSGVSVDDIVRGVTALPLSVEYGGTGANTAAGALANLGIDDHVEAEGTSGGWKYRKWASGLAECWQTITLDFNSWKAWGSVYETDVKTARSSFPFAFKGLPGFSVTATSQLGGIMSVEVSGLISETSTPEFFAIRPTAVSGSEVYDIYFSVYVWGEWK